MMVRVASKFLLYNITLRLVVFVLLNKSDTPWSMSTVHETSSRAHLVVVHVMGPRAFAYKKNKKGDKEKQETLAS